MFHFCFRWEMTVSWILLYSRLPKVGTEYYRYHRTILQIFSFIYKIIVFTLQHVPVPLKSNFNGSNAPGFVIFKSWYIPVILTGIHKLIFFLFVRPVCERYNPTSSGWCHNRDRVGILSGETTKPCCSEIVSNRPLYRRDKNTEQGRFPNPEKVSRTQIRPQFFAVPQSAPARLIDH